MQDVTGKLRLFTKYKKYKKSVKGPFCHFYTSSK